MKISITLIIPTSFVHINLCINSFNGQRNKEALVFALNQRNYRSGFSPIPISPSSEHSIPGVPFEVILSISTVPQARLSPLHTLTLRMQALFVQVDREELHKAIARTGAVRERERGCARGGRPPKAWGGERAGFESVVEGWRMMPWSLDRSRGYATHYHHYYYCSNRHPGSLQPPSTG